MTPSMSALNVWTGDEVGLLKHLRLGAAVDGTQIHPLGKVDRANSIQAMSVCGNELWIARKGGRVECMDFEQAAGQEQSITNQFTLDAGNDDGSAFIGLHVNTEHVVTCTNARDAVVEYRARNFMQEPTTSIAVGADLCRMRVHGCLPQHFSIGGKERELTVYDINASSSNDPIWQAKNVKNDKLDLRVPVWIRDMQFLASEHAKELVTVSSYGHIRIYDTRTARRPVLASKHGELPIKRVLAVPGSSREIIFSDTMGGMFHMDLRSMDKIAGMYKGFVGGAVEDMCVDAAHPDLVASVGIDRYMRVHEIKSRKMVHKVYLKQRMTCVVFGAVEADSAQPNDGVDADADAEEDVWDAIETVVEADSQKSKKVKREKSEDKE